MNKYKKLFFDFDDTLVSFKAADQIALPKVFEAYGLPMTEEVETFYHTYNRSLWDALERAEITREQLLSQRFAVTMSHFGMQVNGNEMDETYRGFIAEEIILIDGAEDVLKTLAQEYELYIITNGVTRTQETRLNASPLKPLIRRMFVSEEAGYQKPQIEIFDYVFSQLDNVHLDECLMIGDSYSADMMGAHHAGIDSCWFNPDNNAVPGIVQPTYIIRTLKELLPIVNSTKLVHK